MRPVLLTLILAVVATPAMAVDGVLEINQTCAVQTGCFAGDTAGYPVTITQPGSYVLTSNLDVPSGSDGVDSSSRGVSLNLNGFEVAGPGSCIATIAASQRLESTICSNVSGVGINGVEAVRDGTVRGFVTGMRNALTTTTRVSEVTFRENQTGLSPSGGRLQIRDSILSTNQSNGIAGQRSSAAYTIRGCLFERNGGLGVYLASGIVSESIFNQNADGIRSNVGGQAIAVNNTFIRNNTAISAGVAVRSNGYSNNGTNGGFPDLGGNVCDGSLTCP